MPPFWQSSDSDSFWFKADSNTFWTYWYSLFYTQGETAMRGKTSINLFRGFSQASVSSTAASLLRLLVLVYNQASQAFRLSQIGVFRTLTQSSGTNIKKGIYKILTYGQASLDQCLKKIEFLKFFTEGILSTLNIQLARLFLYVQVSASVVIKGINVIKQMTVSSFYSAQKVLSKLFTFAQSENFFFAYQKLRILVFNYFQSSSTSIFKNIVVSRLFIQGTATFTGKQLNLGWSYIQASTATASAILVYLLTFSYLQPSNIAVIKVIELFKNYGEVLNSRVQKQIFKGFIFIQNQMQKCFKTLQVMRVYLQSYLLEFNKQIKQIHIFISNSISTYSKTVKWFRIYMQATSIKCIKLLTRIWQYAQSLSQSSFRTIKIERLFSVNGAAVVKLFYLLLFSYTVTARNVISRHISVTKTFAQGSVSFVQRMRFLIFKYIQNSISSLITRFIKAVQIAVVDPYYLITVKDRCTTINANRRDSLEIPERNVCITVRESGKL